MQSPYDARDWVFESFAHGLPKALPVVWLLPDEFPSRAQGDRGTCAAFVACVIREIAMMRAGIEVDPLSPEFVYWHRDNKPASGMYGRAVFKIMQQYGMAPEHLYPYRDADPAIAPTPEVYAQAVGLRISKYARVGTVEGLKLSLYEVGAAYLLLPLFDTRPEFWVANGPQRGTHAVAVIGYNEEGFKLKNSWGEEWNGDGCVYFPFTSWHLVYECWTAMVNFDDDMPGHYAPVQPGDPLNDPPIIVQPPRRKERLMSAPTLPTWSYDGTERRRNSMGTFNNNTYPQLRTHDSESSIVTSSTPDDSDSDNEQKKKCIVM
jgi:Papain family cysteine protease